MPMTDYLQNRFLNASLRGTTYTGTASVYMALFSVSPTDDGSGTELVGSGYARQLITFDPGSLGTVVSNNTVTFGPALATWSTAVAIGIMNANAGGSVLYYKPINNSVQTGASLVFAAGEVLVTLT